MSDHLLCIDFSNLLVRHASNPYGQDKDTVGRPVWGAVGALRQVLRLVDEMKPTHLLIGRDGPRNASFRRELSPAYKAHRSDADEDVKRQFAIAFEAVELFGWPCLNVPSYEADDVIASACHAFPGQATVVSGDRDMLALCSDRVTVRLLRSGGYEALKAGGCEKVMGVPPAKVRDYKSLVGDKSDGISGAAGIGDKGALKILGAYGSVAEAYRRIDAGERLEAITPAVQRKLEEGREDVRLSYQLAGLVTSLPIDVDALRCPPRPTTADHGRQLDGLGLMALKEAIDGTTKPMKSNGPVDMEAAFEQLRFG